MWRPIGTECKTKKVMEGELNESETEEGEMKDSDVEEGEIKEDGEEGEILSDDEVRKLHLQVYVPQNTTVPQNTSFFIPLIKFEGNML